MIFGSVLTHVLIPVLSLPLQTIAARINHAHQSSTVSAAQSCLNANGPPPAPIVLVQVSGLDSFACTLVSFLSFWFSTSQIFRFPLLMLLPMDLTYSVVHGFHHSLLLLSLTQTTTSAAHVSTVSFPVVLLLGVFTTPLHSSAMLQVRSLVDCFRGTIVLYLYSVCIALRSLACALRLTCY